ncbi:receptor-type tyrosine-protein phosphatase beta [Phlebotomus argentipes]|uniref:receptor-type tyrosine-protein phosphatase beta n=1 Tax=Phlebotomus argentipes TaxID=94469 RepID=UPI0028930081|nr:receptor-type tyrosine-protein phosphatase beta [Phlebotomus argentipes]
MSAPVRILLLALVIARGQEVPSPLEITHDDDAGEIREMRRERNSAFEFHYSTTPFSIAFIEEPLVKFVYFNYTRIERNVTEFGNHFVVFDPGKKALTGLAPCSLYSVFGEMRNLATNRTFNHTESISTDYAEPVTTNLLVIPFDDSIVAQWNTSNRDCVGHFVVRVSAGEWTFEANTTRLDWGIDALAPCTEYELEIATVNVFGDVVSSVTEKEVTSFVDPGAVEELVAKYHSGGRVEVSWKPPLDGVECVSDYTVKLGEDSCLDEESCLWTYRNASKSLKGEFDGLEACKRYTIVVYTNGQEDGSNSTLTFDTDFHVPGTVENLNYDVVSPSSVRMFWNAPHENAHCVSHYIIKWADLEETLNGTEILLEDLEPCREYLIAVAVVDIEGEEGQAMTIPVQMPDDVPGIVQDVNYSATPSELMITWKRSQYAGQCVESYRLQISGDISHLEDYNHTTTDTSFIFQRMTACRMISVRIFAVSFVHKESFPMIFVTRIPARITAMPSTPQLVHRTRSSLRLKSSLTDTQIECTLMNARFVCNADEEGIETEILVNVDPLTGNSTEFEGYIDSLPSFTNFNCSVSVLTSAGWSESAMASFQTEEDYPGEPANLVLMETSNKGFHITWERPSEPNGNVHSFRLEIQQVEPLYLVPRSCSPAVLTNLTEETHLQEMLYDKGEPSFTYFVQVAAVNGAGVGVYTKPITIKTLPDIPQQVSDFSVFSVDGPFTPLVYNSTVTIQWVIPCKSNGALRSFEGVFYGTKGDLEHVIEWEYAVRGSVREIYTFTQGDLLPEFQYRVTIAAKVRDVSNTSIDVFQDFNSPAGIPETYGMDNWGTVDVFSSPNPTHSAEICISSQVLNSTAGDILFVALLVSEHGCQDDPVPQFGALGSETNWPAVMRWQEAMEFSCIPQYQTTPIRWRPSDSDFREISEFLYTIGREDCDDSQGYCNGHLRPDTNYSVIVRTFTRHGFSDSAVIHFRTDALVALTTIISIVTSCLLVAFIVGLVIAKRSNSLAKWNTDNLMNNGEIVPDVELKKFSDHYIAMMRNCKENLTKEFKLLNAVTMEKDFSMAAAKQNETKNRYVNIIPYDMNRVLLNIEDGESEYINASFVSGFKYGKEYIATQGPKLETCFDFWRMILQCNVKRIVMLTLLREDDKVKCYGYYPMINMKSKSIQFKDIHVNLESECEFPIYKKRVFLVKRGELEKKVSQYHFTKWPDHGCPRNPTDLIEFTRMYQLEKKNSSSPTVVHCSAGVGRTGTFIALDIIMQTLKNRKSINIYEIVRQLRNERMKMVQTFHQYCLLYQCAYILVNKTSSMRWSKKSVLSRRLSRIQQTPSNSSLQSVGREIPTQSTLSLVGGKEKALSNADSAL